MLSHVCFGYRPSEQNPLPSWSLPQSFLLALLLVEDPRHTVGQLGPVGVQAAAPAGGEPGEEPGLLAVGPVAGTLLLARSAVAGNLQADILDQVPTEGGPPGLLDVQKHDHVLPLDLEIDRPLQVPDGEVVFLNVVGVRSGEDVPLVLFGEITVRGAEIDHPRSHVLIENQHKAHGSDDDQQEFAAPLDHDPAQCGPHSALPFPSPARHSEHGARLLHFLPAAKKGLAFGPQERLVRCRGGRRSWLMALRGGSTP